MPTPEKDWQALLQQPLPVSAIYWPDAKACVPSFMVHLEQRENHINGNKGFKALPNLMAAKAAGFNQVLSFGGRHSNHLHALAFACKRYQLKLIAVVRGYQEQAITPTIKALQNAGATIYFVGNNDYKKRYDDDGPNRIPYEKQQAPTHFRHYLINGNHYRQHCFCPKLKPVYCTYKNPIKRN